MNECRLLISENIKNQNTTKKKQSTNLIKTIQLSGISGIGDFSVMNINILVDNDNDKIITVNLDEKINNKINLLFKKYYLEKPLFNKITWFNKKIDQREIFKSSLKKIIKFKNNLDSNNILLESGDIYIINMAQEYFNNNNFNVIKEGIIEYWSFDINNDENNAIIFDIYKDDELYDFNVDTCIFYTLNDIKLKGNLDYYKKESIPFTLNTNIIKKEIKISSNLLILISGNQIYNQQPLYGCGKRNYIIVKMRSHR